jgi:hypothetical protein
MAALTRSAWPVSSRPKRDQGHDAGGYDRRTDAGRAERLCYGAQMGHARSLRPIAVTALIAASGACGGEEVVGPTLPPLAPEEVALCIFLDEQPEIVHEVAAQPGLSILSSFESVIRASQRPEFIDALNGLSALVEAYNDAPGVEARRAVNEAEAVFPSICDDLGYVR